MKQDLADPAQRAVLGARLRRLAPDSQRQWGRMTSHQVVCHLSDSFRAIMGSKSALSIATPLSRTVIKWIALNAPMKWPPGVKTVPEVDQEFGGTKPVEFASDRQELEALMEQFAAKQERELQPHPMFGRMTTEQWQRWGWRHMDHHLRQFNL
jgi:Protein of unknown function (DUF1569)